ncbi:MAG: hypothetical protein ABJH98_16075 [Reichenbachiella sp.]|uniref:hypothetical protein n=1 Tax=Reichenbachiella sp. TaxID=2184521 RepID=UPI00329739A2
MNKTFILAFFTCLISCLSPDDIEITSDTDAKSLDDFLRTAISDQEGVILNKVVVFDDQTESAQLKFDTLTIKKDLKKLVEFSFARLIRSTNYNKTIQKDGVLFERKLKEKKGPISIEVGKSNLGLINSLRVKFEEENYLYQSNQIIQLSFAGKKLVNYKIEEVQKLIGMDPSSQSIEVRFEKL